MKYRFSKLSSIAEKDNHIIIEAHAASTEIELFEEAYVDEFRALKQNGGTDQIASELECALFEQKVLIEENYDEIKFLTDEIDAFDNRSYNLILFPTEECNLRCIYCYENFNSSELTQMHYDLLFSEVEKAIERGKSEVAISWFGGEPLLKLENVLCFSGRIRDLTAVKGTEFSGSIATNGVLLDADAHKSLCEHGVTSFQITLDGFAHDNQRIFPNGSGSFDIVLGNIRGMLDSNLNFKLTLRVNITDADFDFSFYDLFLPYVGDKRLSFFIKPVSQWGKTELSLPVLKVGASSEQMLNKHKNYLKDMGFTIYGENAKGILSGGCYAAQRDMFVIRANGRIAKCTVALDDEINDIGYLDLEKGEMVIDYNSEEQWSYNPLSYNCYRCKKLATCCNRSCPLNKLRFNTDRCCV